MFKESRGSMRMLLLLCLFSILKGCLIVYWPDFPVTKLDHLHGTVQKGPFQKGSAIVIQELDEQLQYIDEEYVGEVLDDLGNYSIPDLKLKYPVVEVIARGYYFNENRGDISDSLLELTALADAGESNRINVNILTHLESARIKYLISRGESFVSAKYQAKVEVLEAFGIKTVKVDQLHNMDICGGEIRDAILLACSLVLQGDLSSSEFSKLLDDFREDIREDGKMDDERINRVLFLQASAIEPDLVEAILHDWYLDHSIQWELLFFEDYINTILMAAYGRL